ncbi:hypothetical protein A7D00_3375 [Trichophyton violaceum]|uniref:Hemolysin-III family protein n=1 Tax=Trichophyton violaceum TaxID=34388 RepID=A0A178FK87_TRIVO|nr:hypothetical protein A7D00_3375 [Trichophyton violaceum]
MTVLPALRSRGFVASRPPRVDLDETPPLLPRKSQEHGALTLSNKEVPHWLGESNYILTGYRVPCNSTARCFYSWFYTHNETVNIYTHLIPAIGFAAAEGFVFRHFEALYPEAPVADKVVFSLFLLTAIMCMSCSTLLHTFMSHSEKVAKACLRADYMGIAGLIFGDIISGTYVVFYSDTALWAIYWTTTFAFGSLTCMILFHPKFEGEEYRTFRAWTFICTGLSSLAPLMHAIILYGLEEMMEHGGLPYYLLEGLLHIIGVAFYVTRIPESLRPGKFDIWFNSHQIFHILVVLATISQVIGIWSAYDHKYYTEISLLH